MHRTGQEVWYERELPNTLEDWENPQRRRRKTQELASANDTGCGRQTSQTYYNRSLGPRDRRVSATANNSSNTQLEITGEEEKTTTPTNQEYDEACPEPRENGKKNEPFNNMTHETKIIQKLKFETVEARPSNTKLRMKGKLYGKARQNETAPEAEQSKK